MFEVGRLDASQKKRTQHKFPRSDTLYDTLTTEWAIYEKIPVRSSTR